MPLSLTLLLPLLAQAGVAGTAPGNGPALPQAPITIPQRKSAASAAPENRPPQPAFNRSSCRIA